MIINKKIIILLILTLCTSCKVIDDCISPGEDIFFTSKLIDVPVYKEGIDLKNKSTLWIDSGITITAKQKTTLAVYGAINFCEKDTLHPRKIVVPSVFCADGSIPNYLRDNDYTAMSICKHTHGKFSSKGYYVDSGIFVNPDERLKFSLVKQEVKLISCKDLNNGKFGTDSKTLNECIKSPTIYGGLVKYVTVNNALTPYGNKVYPSFIPDKSSPFRINNYRMPWYNGTLFDLRGSPAELTSYDKNTICKLPLDPQIKQYDTYELNYYCGNICNENISTTNCISSIFYEGERGKIKRDPKKELANSWAGLLVAKIGDGRNDQNAIAEQCIPGNIPGNKCMSAVLHSLAVRQNSIQLDHPYKVDKSVKKNSKLMLGISDWYNFADNAGGYYVEVQHSCISVDGEKLYMYVGNNPPDFAPGEGLGKEISLNRRGFTSKHWMLSLNDPTESKHLQHLSGRIYFGIQGAADSQTGGYAKSSTSDNKYSVNIYRAKLNNTISSLFNKIIKEIVEIMYGKKSSSTKNDTYIASKGGLIREMYNNIIVDKFRLFIQIVIVLYIIFYGFMILLGLTKIKQTDIVIMVLKIGLVLQLFNPNSWEFFSSHFFSFFLQESSNLISIFAVSSEQSNNFAFLDQMLIALSSDKTWLRLGSLFFAGPVGWLAIILVFWGIWNIFTTALFAIFIYIFAIIAISLLLAISPLFITSILFQKTKILFDNWLKLIIAFTLQPVFMFVFLAMFSQLLMLTFYEINNFTACNDCFAAVTLVSDNSKDHDDIKFCFLETIMPIGNDNTMSIEDRLKTQTEEDTNKSFFGLPISMVSILIFIIVSKAAQGFVRISQNIADAVTNTMIGQIRSTSSAAHEASQALLSVVGLDQSTQGGIKQAIKRKLSTRSIEIKAMDTPDKPKEDTTPKPQDNGESSENRSSDTDERSSSGTSSEEDTQLSDNDEQDGGPDSSNERDDIELEDSTPIIPGSRENIGSDTRDAESDRAARAREATRAEQLERAAANTPPRAPNMSRSQSSSRAGSATYEDPEAIELDTIEPTDRTDLPIGRTLESDKDSDLGPHQSVVRVDVHRPSSETMDSGNDREPSSTESSSDHPTEEVDVQPQQNDESDEEDKK